MTQVRLTNGNGGALDGDGFERSFPQFRLCISVFVVLFGRWRTQCVDIVDLMQAHFDLCVDRDVDKITIPH
jgi:hypothetical protein